MDKLILLAAFCFLAACHYRRTKREFRDQIVLIDTTQNLTVQPLAAPILSGFDFSENRNIKACLGVGFLNDKVFNKIEEEFLPYGDTSVIPWNTDYGKRSKQVNGFCNRCEQRIKKHQQLEGHTYHCDKSEIARGIARALNVFEGASWARVVAFSDVQEHSDLFNCYDESQRRLLIEHPEKVAEIFANRIEVKSQNNVYLFIICEPSKADEQTFLAMVKAYSIWLSKYNIKVVARPENDKLYD